jgi:recombination protein RecT
MAFDLVAVIDSTRKEFESMAQNEKSIEFEKEKEFAIQAIRANETLYAQASKDPQALMNAMKNVASIGLSLNPVAKHTYIVPRDGKLCLDISARGLIHLATKSGNVSSFVCEIVYEKEVFKTQADLYLEVGKEAFNMPPIHIRDPFASNSAKGEPRGVYCYIKLRSGDIFVHTMSIEDVYKSRNKSQSYNGKNKNYSPWVQFPAEMIKKTCIKQAAKYWPAHVHGLSNPTQFDSAVNILNNESGEGIEMESNSTSSTLYMDGETIEAEVVTPLVDEEYRKKALATINAMLEKFGFDMDMYFSENQIPEGMIGYTKRQVNETYGEIQKYLDDIDKKNKQSEASNSNTTEHEIAS